MENDRIIAADNINRFLRPDKRHASSRPPGFDKHGFSNEGATIMRYVLTIAALLLASQSWAQQAPPATPTQPTDPAYRAPGTPATDPALRTGTSRDPAAHTQRGMRKVVRASKIIGINVKNKADEELGTINDIVLDPADGRIAYAAVSMGGFLGVGDKLFAVPWEALECREVNGQHVAILDIDKQRMEHAQGFDQDHWPDMANEKWRMENDRPYRMQRQQGHEVYKPVQPGTQHPETQPRLGQPLPESQPRQRQPQPQQ
jgi:sporulation protein YlmC with PRC-barrel domain